MLKLKFDEKGLIPAIIQDAKTKEVLMLAYMNAESIRRTLKTGKTWFYSRSRKKFWMKGEESGNVQKVKKILIDCDADTILILVEPKGPACHEGYNSCFFRKINGKIILKRIFDPKKVYKK
ncbi:MAG TPA: phosphoribosyl-AMP cyclohydrolase [Elusimicrobia bacterium]|nr:phosphoribosyl-AMP cyclohydrolase [Elusimicrobiota bacterium]